MKFDAKNIMFGIAIVLIISAIIGIARPVLILSNTGITDTRTNKKNVPVESCVVDIGGTGDSTSIQWCINNKPGLILIKNGTYHVTNTITINYSNIKLIGEGNVILNFDSTNGISIIGGDGQSRVALTSSGAKGNNTVTVSDTSDFTIGEATSIWANDYVGRSGANAMKGEYFIVTAKTATKLTLDGRLSFTYSTGANNASIKPVDLSKNIEISGIIFNGTDSGGTQICLLASAVQDLYVHDNTFQNCGSKGIAVSGYHTIISNNKFQDILYADLGYGVSNEYSSKYLYVYDNFFRNVDEAYDCGGSSLVHGTPTDSYVYDNVIIYAASNGLDTHPSCVNQYFTNNKISNLVDGSAIMGESDNLYIEGNTIEDCSDYGISVYGGYSEGSQIAGLVTIKNNDLRRVALNAGSKKDSILVQNYTNVIISGNSIYDSGNDVRNSVDIAITNGCKNATITYNTIFNTHGGYRSIYTSDTVTNSYLQGNSFYYINGADTMDFERGTYPDNCNAASRGSEFVSPTGKKYYCTGTNWIDLTGNFTTIKAQTIQGTNKGNFTKIFFGDGTESLPSMTFTDDPNTGFWRYTADQIAMSLGGTAKIYYAATGFDRGASGFRMMIETPTSTNPVYAFYNDEDTGLGWQGANNISIIAGGSEAIRIRSGETEITGVSGDGTGKAVCVKSTGVLGTCSNAVNASGFCTCA